MVRIATDGGQRSTSNWIVDTLVNAPKKPIFYNEDVAPVSDTPPRKRKRVNLNHLYRIK